MRHDTRGADVAAQAVVQRWVGVRALRDICLPVCPAAQRPPAMAGVVVASIACVYVVSLRRVRVRVMLIGRSDDHGHEQDGSG